MALFLWLHLLLRHEPASVVSMALTKPRQQAHRYRLQLRWRHVR